MIRFTMFAVTGLLALALIACSSSEEAAKDYARKQADEARQKRSGGPGAVKVATPVPGGKHIACEDLLDPTAFTDALGEAEPVVMEATTGSDGEATAVCSIARGGEPLALEQQEKMLEKQRTLGVLPGDELCSISLYCWQIAEDEAFRSRCSRLGNQLTRDDLPVESCVQVTQRGEYDAYAYQAIDRDTRCIIGARGGPSMNDRDTVRSCAKLAMQQIGPEQIARHEP